MRARRGGIVVPALAAGAAMALSLPPWGWWPLAFAGSALLYWRLRALPPARRALTGWLAGLGCFVPGLWWAGHFNWYGAAVLMVVESLAPAAAATAVTRGPGRPAVMVGAFTLAEAARMSWPFGGVPLGSVFLGQAGGPLLPAARLGGPLLLVALVFAGGVALAEAVRAAGAAWPGGRTSAGGRRAAAVAVAAAAVVVGLGVGGALAPDGGTAVHDLRVALVQGGGQRGTSAEQVPSASVFAAHLAASRLVPRRDGGRPPELIVWPEDTVTMPDQPATLRASGPGRTMAALARRAGATVVAGVTIDVAHHAFRNEAVAWGPRGAVVGAYEKVHRVPFGEYVPYRRFFSHLADLSAVPLDEVPGHGDGSIRTPAGRLGVMVSYEVFFAARAREPVRAGARLLVVPTNTSSYPTAQVPSQELAASRVQAVALGRDLVQAAPTGYSAVVDQAGRVRRRSRLGARQVLVADVGLRSGRTPYERAGDLPVLVAAGVLVAGGWLTAPSRRRSPRRGRGVAHS